MTIEAQSMVIIGGSSGMGLAIAKEAVDAGADVTIAGRSLAKLDEARRAIAGDVTTRTVDLLDGHPHFNLHLIVSNKEPNVRGNL